MIRKMTIGGALLALSMGIGCAGATQELQAARDAYDQAAQGEAARVAPAKVWEAKQALQRAEQEHEANPGSRGERDLAYIALRRANLATAFANMKVAEQEKKNAQDQYSQVLEMQRDQSRVTLSQRERELERTRQSLQSQQQEMASREQELQAAREAREQLERQLGVALGSLEQLATVERDEQNRLVITLSGEVLFGFDDDQLLPVAERRLQKVAKVLQEYGEQGTIVVEGHTDAIGPEDYNKNLSERRAQSVADFLAEHGVERQALQTVGQGESDPLVPNDSPENRANNRRVEIIIEEPEQTALRQSQEGAVMEGQGPSEED